MLLDPWLDWADRPLALMRHTFGPLRLPSLRRDAGKREYAPSSNPGRALTRSG
jgi:hypothetical protein